VTTLDFGSPGSIKLNPPPSDKIISSSIDTGGAIYYVASFHTHTPTIDLLPFDYRFVGPSDNGGQGDYAAALAGMRPGLVYDYLPSPSNGSTVSSGLPLGSPAKIYPLPIRQVDGSLEYRRPTSTVK
jgi:hypothetical protein